MQKKFSWAALLLLFIMYGCKTSQPVSVASTDDGKLEAVFVQVNDVYEIAPLENGSIGGMARVASLKKKYQKENKNTFLLMAGDFLSPSIFNGLKYQGAAIRGKQMVDCMNAAGFDLVVFGNHEFDIKEKELQDRINESEFQWLSSNCMHKVAGGNALFQKQKSSGSAAIPTSYILNLEDADGTRAKIGFLSVTLPFNKASYVTYLDPLSAAKKVYAELKNSCDAVIALTHQSIEADEELARTLPGLAAIMGGHEHDFRFEKLGTISITKAHANAKSAFVIKVLIDKKLKSTTVSSTLQKMDESVPADSATAVVVNKWTDFANNNYNALGFDSKQVLIAKGDAFDGRESEVRNRSTTLTKIIVAAMSQACPQADAAILNSGSIRVDDWLYAPVVQSDIIRTLPFGGAIREMDLKGSLLIQILKVGQKNIGTGGFLQYQNIDYDEAHKKWTIHNNPILPDKRYRIAMSDFLISGKEVNLDFLNPQNGEIIKLYDAVAENTDSRSDIRLAVVKYLQSTFSNH